MAQEFVSLGMICEDRLLSVLYSGLYVPRYKIVFVPEWCLSPVRPVVVVGVYGLTVVRDRASFVVFGFLYLVSPSPLVLRNGGTGCGSRRIGRRARLEMAPLPAVPTYRLGLGGIVVIPYCMCIVARRDFVCPFPGRYILEPVSW